MSTLQNTISRSMLLLALTLGTTIPAEVYAGCMGSHGCPQQQQAPCGRSGRCFKRPSCKKGCGMRRISSCRSRCGGKRCRRSC